MKKIWICLLFLLIFSSSCNMTREVNEVVNHVTNEITNKNVKVEDYTIEDLENAVQLCIEKVEHSVIGILCRAKNTIDIDGTEYDYYEKESLGSAVIYKKVEHRNSEDVIDYYTYYAYTNCHVVLSNRTGIEHKIFAYFQDGDLEIEAEVLGYDNKIDIAAIRFNSYFDLEPVKIADSSSVEKGSFVVAIGNPEGFNYYGTSTFGIVTNNNVYKSSDTDGDNVGDFVSQYVVTDAAINEGCSGGGLFLLDGSLVGINTLKIIVNNTENMGFAIPSNIVKKAVDDYLEKGLTIQRPRLGIVCNSVRDANASFMTTNKIASWPNVYDGEQPYGLFVSSKSNTGSIATTDIKERDIILKFDDIKIYDTNDLSGRLNSLFEYNIGDTVKITYYSDETKEVKTIDVVLKAE